MSERFVIPQNFLFGLHKQGERKFMRNPIWFFGAIKTGNRIPDKRTFLPRQKSALSGMTGFVLRLGVAVCPM
jgi:hypothetical protein